MRAHPAPAPCARTSGPRPCRGAVGVSHHLHALSLLQSPQIVGLNLKIFVSYRVRGIFEVKTGSEAAEAESAPRPLAKPSRRGAAAGLHRAAMVVERSVVEMVLERGETRHDVVVNGLKEIALCGKVCLCAGAGAGVGVPGRACCLVTGRRHRWATAPLRSAPIASHPHGAPRRRVQGVTEEISTAYARFQQDGSIDGLTGIAASVPAGGAAAVSERPPRVCARLPLARAALPTPAGLTSRPCVRQRRWRRLSCGPKATRMPWGERPSWPHAAARRRPCSAATPTLGSSAPKRRGRSPPCPFPGLSEPPLCVRRRVQGHHRRRATATQAPRRPASALFRGSSPPPRGTRCQQALRRTVPPHTSAALMRRVRVRTGTWLRPPSLRRRQTTSSPSTFPCNPPRPLQGGPRCRRTAPRNRHPPNHRTPATAPHNASYARQTSHTPWSRPSSTRARRRMPPPRHRIPRRRLLRSEFMPPPRSAN